MQKRLERFLKKNYLVVYAHIKCTILVIKSRTESKALKWIITTRFCYCKSCLTSTLHDLVNLAFNMQLWMLCLDTFKFDCHFFWAGHIRTWTNTKNKTILPFTEGFYCLSYALLFLRFENSRYLVCYRCVCNLSQCIGWQWHDFFIPIYGLIFWLPWCWARKYKHFPASTDCRSGTSTKLFLNILILLYLHKSTNRHQWTSHSTTSCPATWRSHCDHRLLWCHFALSIDTWMVQKSIKYITRMSRALKNCPWPL